ncbi:MAG: phosphoadenylyl-sulfate reductase [Actinomycetota bacterium]|nr:phosphoadenylyl-sulfate reductase [Actinomycetota bacterium]
MAFVFENAHPLEVLRWAGETFGDGLVVTASFGDPTLPHLVSQSIPWADVVMLDTGYLFAETEWYADHLADRFGIRVRSIHPRPDIGRDVWQQDPDACCRARKVEPLERALAGAAAWVTGVRRSDGDARRSIRIVHDDPERAVTKINPLATWDAARVADHIASNDLPLHPLADRGYGSIGCWPCTSPLTAGEDERAGRWRGSDKIECGLHLTATGVPVTVSSIT